MIITKSDIEKFHKLKRLNLVNTISGFKPANLVGTINDRGITNLSIISSVIHLSSSPALLGFIQRPTTVPRHTYSNIKQSGCYTINHVHSHFIDRAHYTSAKFEEEISEFEVVGLTEEYINEFPAPFVKESQLKIAMEQVEEYHIASSNTILVVGAIQFIQLPEGSLEKDGELDLSALDSIAISGLNHYHTTNKIATFPYARPGNWPKNEQSE